MYHKGAFIGPFSVRGGTMPRRSRNDQELNWLRSAWEELAAAELNHSGFITIKIKPTAMRARFYVKWEFTRPEVDGKLDRYFAAKQTSYPNGDATNFLSWLWNQSRLFSEQLDADDVQMDALIKK
jgi:hypothetical protein